MRSALFAATGLVLMTSLIANDAQAQPISGLYIGASGGVNFLQDERIRGFITPGVSGTQLSAAQLSYKTGYVGLASLGYGFGNGVRLELEGSARSNDRKFPALPAGVTNQSGSEMKYGAMANVLFDLDVRSPYIFPYLGAGAGYQSVKEKLAQTVNGAPQQINQDKSAFAYQAMFGAAFPIPGLVGLSATAEYRYLGMTGVRSYNATSRGNLVFTRRTTDDDNHQILVGLRFAFNVTPPTEGVAPASPAVAAPAPAAARSYLVFFDWDRADLNDRARAIIAEAATASTRTQTTRIEVAGHADRTGTEAYNQGLSRRRAAMVAAELVRKGVPVASIAVSSFGDTQPLVPTAAGVREPQNRRVEIVLK